MKKLKKFFKNVGTMILLVVLLSGALLLAGMSDPGFKEITDQEYWKIYQIQNSFDDTNVEEQKVSLFIDKKLIDGKITTNESDEIYELTGKLGKSRLLKK